MLYCFRKKVQIDQFQINRTVKTIEYVQSILKLLITPSTTFVLRKFNLFSLFSCIMNLTEILNALIFRQQRRLPNSDEVEL